MDKLAESFTSLTFEQATISVLGLSSLIVVADAAGILPGWISNWVNRNQAARTMETLRRLGVDVPGLRRRNRASSIAVHAEGATLRDRVAARLESFRLTEPMTVGSVNRMPATSFIDVMGATADPGVAQLLAADLVAHWRNVLSDQTVMANPNVDFVVTPKSGSPLLGAEVARALNVPFALHNEREKFNVGAPRFAATFDCPVVPPPGSRALLVDDSSTGGAKAASAVRAINIHGYEISDFLMLFEPTLKRAQGANARSKLSALGVALHAIVQD